MFADIYALRYNNHISGNQILLLIIDTLPYQTNNQFVLQLVFLWYSWTCASDKQQQTASSESCAGKTICAISSIMMKLPACHGRKFRKETRSSVKLKVRHCTRDTRRIQLQNLWTMHEKQWNFLKFPQERNLAVHPRVSADLMKSR